MTSLIELVKQDLQKSGIDDETAALNFFPINGPDAFDEVYGDKAKRINTGALSRGWMEKYYKLESFLGWICNGRIRHLAGQPFTNEEGEAIRYMSRLGEVTPITFIKPGGRALAMIEARHGIAKPPGMDFWDWVRDYNIPLVITEGEKKAAALICAGIVAISLPGIFTGFQAIRDDWGKTVSRLLREELSGYDTAGRSICIMFDRRPDVDFETTVEFKAAAILSRQFQHATVRVAELQGPYKGADDYLAAGDGKAIERALRSAKSANSYEHTRLWKEYRKFNATNGKTRDYFFQAPEPGDGTITIVKSNLNSGKSEWLGNTIPKVKKVKKSHGKGFLNKATADGVMVSLGHRNSLQEQLCDRWDFDHLDLHDAYGRFKDPNLRVALCFDSLLKLPPEIFVGATVVIDESMTALKHLLTSTTLRGKRLEIIQRFEYIIKVCNRILLLDGNMADWMGDYVASLDGNKQVVKYDNESDRPTPPIYFVDADNLTKRKADEWLNLQILESTLPAVVVDSIIKAEAIAQQLQKLKGDGLLITSKTVTEKWVREFLKAPDAYIDNNPGRVNWICCTPTVESGVTINNVGKFDTVFCWFVGVVGINEAVQMSRRVRNPDRVIVYAPKVGINHKRNSGAFEQILMEDLANRIGAEAGTFAGTLGDKVIETLKAQLESPHIIAWGKMQAIEYLENRNYSEFLYLAFESMGMKPQKVEAYEIDSAAYKDAKLEVQIVECTQIFNAPDLTEIEAEAIAKKLDSNWAERCSVIKYKLLNRFPGLAKSSLWSIDFVHRIRYRERALSSQLELFWLLTHPEQNDALKAQQWADKTDVDFFIPDRVGNDRWLFVKVLQKLKFTDFIDGHTYSDQSAEVIEFIRAIRWQKTVSRVVGHPGGSSNLTFLNRDLMPTLGIRPVKRQVRLPPPVPGVDGKRIYTYWYDPVQSHPENWAELMQFVDRRFRQRLGEELPDIDTDDRSNTGSVTLPADSDRSILEPTQIEGFEADDALEPYSMAGVTGFTNNIQLTDKPETNPQTDPIFEENGARSAETLAEATIEAIGFQARRVDEEGHKYQDADFLTVWVRTKHDDRPQFESALLLDCDGEGFKVAIEGEVWEIPCDDLAWSPPAPS